MTNGFMTKGPMTYGDWTICMYMMDQQSIKKNPLELKQSVNKVQNGGRDHEEQCRIH